MYSLSEPESYWLSPSTKTEAGLKLCVSDAVTDCSQGLQPGGRAISPTATTTGSPLDPPPEATVPVEAEVADPEPEALLAVTETRTVDPTSLLPRRYVDVAAPTV